MFWVIAGAMVLLVMAAVLAPMLRAGAGEAASPEVAFYKAQLAEIDRDVARGVLDGDEAERARTEIARRLLTASRAGAVASGQAPFGATRAMAIGALVLVAGIAGASYLALGHPGLPDQPLTERLARSEEMRETRPDQATLEASVPPAAPPEDAPEDYLESVAQLRVLMQARPDELEGWQLLAFHENQLRDYAAAARAQGEVIRIKGADTTIEDRRILLDLLVAATDGLVSPEAEAVAARIISEAPDNVAARYYLGALYAQTGRPDVAFRFWRPLLDEGAEGFHVELARAQIEEAAAMAGIDYTAPERRGPSLADIQAAEDMTPEQRDGMIRGMVAQLSDRLATEGGGPADWARLISAYGVLGETQAAAEIWTEARDVFGADADALARLEEAARQAGVLE